MKISQLIILLLNVSFLIQTEVEEDTSIKAFSCHNLLNKQYKGKDEIQPSVHSPIMLSCFIKISEEQSQKILSSMDSEELPIDQEEFDQLIDTEILNTIPDDELKEKVNQLEKAVKDFQKYDKDFEDSKNEANENFDNYDYNYDDDYGNYNEYNEDFNYDDMNYNDYYNNDFDNTDENSSKLKEFFDESKGLWIGIFICVIVFVLILLFGKEYDENENDKNKSE